MTVKGRILLVLQNILRRKPEGPDSDLPYAVLDLFNYYKLSYNAEYKAVNPANYKKVKSF